MNDNIKRDRSPNAPRFTLSESVELVSNLYKKVGKAQIKPQVAASTLGYASLNGSALGAIGAFNQYGLIERSRGEGLSISQLAIKLIHPVNDDQLLAAKREAALKPNVYADLYAGNFQHCAEDVIKNHLIQEGFTANGARKTAAVFKANIEYANLLDENFKLDSESKITQNENVTETSIEPKPLEKSSITSKDKPIQEDKDLLKREVVLANYSIPLVECEAVLVFKGERLTSKDFDALIEYVELFKRRIVRQQREIPKIPASLYPEPPFARIIKTDTGDLPIEVVKSVIRDGEKYYETADGKSFHADIVYPDIKKK